MKITVGCESTNKRKKKCLYTPIFFSFKSFRVEDKLFSSVKPNEPDDNARVILTKTRNAPVVPWWVKRALNGVKKNKMKIHNDDRRRYRVYNILHVASSVHLYASATLPNLLLRRHTVRFGHSIQWSEN